MTLQHRSKEGRTSRETGSPASGSTPLTTSMPTPCGEVAHDAHLEAQVHRRRSPRLAPTNVVAAAKTRGSFALTDEYHALQVERKEKRGCLPVRFVGFSSFSRCLCVGGCVLYSLSATLSLSRPTNNHLEKTHDCSLRPRALLLLDPLAELCIRTCVERFALTMRLALVSVNPL